MNRIKRSLLFKTISIALTITFIALDISWAYPVESHNTNSSTLATPSLLQQQPVNEHAARFQQSLFSRGELLGSVCSIGKYLLEEKLPLKHLEQVMSAELGEVARGIGLSRVTVKDGVVLIPCEVSGKKRIVQIALRDALAGSKLAGYDWLISDKYVVKELPEGSGQQDSGASQTPAAPTVSMAARIAGLMAKRDALPQQADLLVVFGSADARVAHKAAELFRGGTISKVLVAGKYGEKVTPDPNNPDFGRDENGNIVEAEALIYKRILMEDGVPEDAILVEKESRGMTDNGINSVKLLIQQGFTPATIIFMHAPLLQLRGSLSLRKALAGAGMNARVYDYAAPIELDADREAGRVIFQAGKLSEEIAQVAGQDKLDEIKRLLAALKSEKEEPKPTVSEPIAEVTAPSRSFSIRAILDSMTGKMFSIEPILAIIIAYSLFSAVKDFAFEYPVISVPAAILLLFTIWRVCHPVSFYIWRIRHGFGSYADKEKLVKIGAPAVPYLIRALKDKKSYVRSDFVMILGRIKDSRSIERIIEMLSDPDKTVRSEAAKALGGIRSINSVKPLIAALNDKESVVKSNAAKALGEMKDASAIEALLTLLNDKNTLVSGSAGVALGEIGSPAVLPLIDILNGLDNDARPRAALALGHTKDARAIESLVKALSDKNSNVRHSAAIALDVIGWRPQTEETKIIYLIAKGSWSDLVKIGPAAIPNLVQILKDDDGRVRHCAVAALGEIKDISAVESLILSLSDKDWQVCAAAAKALGDIKDTRALDPLIQALRNENHYIRWSAAGALGCMGDMRAIKPLVEALGDRNNNVSDNAAKVLGKIGVETVPSLIQVLNDGKEHAPAYAARALGIIKDARAVEPLIRMLKEKSDLIRSDAVRALRDIKDKRASAPLVLLLNNGSYIIRSDVAIALLEINDPALSFMKDYLIAMSKYTQYVDYPYLALDFSKPFYNVLTDEELAYISACLKTGEEIKAQCVPCISHEAYNTDPYLIEYYGSTIEVADSPARLIFNKKESSSAGQVSQGTKMLSIDPFSATLIASAAYAVLSGLKTLIMAHPVIAGLSAFVVIVVVPVVIWRVYYPMGWHTWWLRNNENPPYIVAEALMRAPYLIELLHSGDNYIRWRAAEVLGNKKYPEAVDPLITSLGDEDEHVRQRAAWSLGNIGATKAIGPLIGLLGDKSEYAREAAINALAMIGAPVIEPLVKLLPDKNLSIRSSAAQVLKKIGWVPPSTELNIRYLIAQGSWDALVEIGIPAIPYLVELLESDNKHFYAAITLGKLKDPRALKYLAKFLDRQDAIETIGCIDGPEAAEFLIGVLGRKPAPNFTDNRRTAITAISNSVHIKNPSVIEPLIKLMEDPNRYIRRDAAEALSKAGWTPADSGLNIKYLIAQAKWDELVKIGANAVPQLIKTLGNDNGWAHKELAKTLLDIGDSRIAFMKDYLELIVSKANGYTPSGFYKPLTDEEVRLITDSLGSGKPLYAELINYTSHYDTGTDAYGVDWSNEVADTPARLIISAGAIEKAQPEEQPVVRPEAPRPGALRHIALFLTVSGIALLAWRIPYIRDLLVAHPFLSAVVAAGFSIFVFWRIFYPVSWHMYKMSDNYSYEKHNKAIIKMGAFAVPYLVSYLDSRDHITRYRAIKLLGEIKDERAIGPLVQRLGDSDSSMRFYAAEALSGIGWKPETQTLDILYMIAKREWTSLTGLGAVAVPHLIRALDDTDSTIRLGAALALGGMGSSIIPRLTQLLSEDNGNLRAGAVTAMGHVKDADTVGTLIGALRDKESVVRFAAAGALAGIGWKPGNEELNILYLTAKEDWQALGKKDWKALETLGHVPVSYLIKLLSDDKHSVRAGSAGILLKLEKPSMDPMKDYLKVIAFYDGSFYTKLTDQEAEYIAARSEKGETIEAQFVNYVSHDERNPDPYGSNIKVADTPARLVIKMDQATAVSTQVVPMAPVPAVPQPTGSISNTMASGYAPDVSFWNFEVPQFDSSKDVMALASPEHIESILVRRNWVYNSNWEIAFHDTVMSKINMAQLKVPAILAALYENRIISSETPLISIYLMGSYPWSDSPNDIDIVVVVGGEKELTRIQGSALPVTPRQVIPGLETSFEIVGLETMKRAARGEEFNLAKVTRRKLTAYSGAPLLAGVDIFANAKIPLENFDTMQQDLIKNAEFAQWDDAVKADPAKVELKRAWRAREAAALQSFVKINRKKREIGLAPQRKAALEQISSSSRAEIVKQKEMFHRDVFLLVQSKVPEWMFSLRQALEDLKPLSEQVGVSADAISTAISEAKKRHDLSDEDTKVLWLAMTGPGQGTGAIKKEAEAGEPPINNKRAEFVKAGKEAGIDIDKSMASAEVRQRVERAIAAIESMESRGVPPETKAAMDLLKKDLDQFEADGAVGSMIILARRAHRENQKLIIGLETDWIPALDKRDSLQKQAIAALMKEISGIAEALKAMGLDNVEIICGNGSDLAGKILERADKTNTNLHNVVIMASASTINSENFTALRSTDEGSRPFLAAIDPQELTEFYAKFGEATDKQLHIKLAQMLYIALELAAGKEPPQIPMIASYDKSMRMVVFLPKAEPMDYEALRDAYKAERSALVAA